MLNNCFNTAIKSIEKITNCHVDQLIKGKVWTIFSKDKLGPLKANMIQEYCDKILGNVTDQQALEEFEKDRLNPNDANSALRKAVAEKGQEVIAAVIKTAGSQTVAYFTEIIDALKVEGIPLPAYNKQT